MDLNVTLKTWMVQATQTSGYVQPLSVGWDVFTPIAEHSVILADKDYELRQATGPVHVESKLGRFSTDDLNTNNATLGTRANFSVTSGTFVTINLDTQVSISKSFPNIETEHYPADVLGHWLRDYARVQRILYEDAFLNKIYNDGLDITNDVVVKTNDDAKKVVMYDTFANINEWVEEKYWDKSATIIYISPAMGKRLMLDDSLTKNSFNRIQAEEIRYQGYIGNFAGIPIVTVPRLQNKGSVVNMLVVYKPQVFFYQYIDLPVTLVQSPSDYVGKTTILMKSLEYFGVALMNDKNDTNGRPSAAWLLAYDGEVPPNQNSNNQQESK